MDYIQNECLSVTCENREYKRRFELQYLNIKNSKKLKDKVINNNAKKRK